MAVDDVVVAVGFGRGLHAGHVGAGTDLADADAADFLAGDGGAQEFLLLVVVAEAGQGRRAHVGLDANGQGDAAGGGDTEFFGGHEVVAVVEAHAAVFLGLLDAEEAEVAEFPEDLVDGVAAVAFPFVAVGVDFVLDEIADGFSEGLVFFGELHWVLASVLSLDWLLFAGL